MTAIHLLSDLVMPISEAKKDPMALARDTESGPVAVLNRNRPVMYCISPTMFENMLEQIEDSHLRMIAEERLSDESEAVSVSLGEL